MTWINPLSYFSFEKELKTKLALKAVNGKTEEQILLKLFKQFDLNNNGIIEKEEFSKAI